MHTHHRRIAVELIEVGDAGYDDARRLFNGRLDRHPVAIARCARVDDVIAATQYAAERGLTLAVRGSGHGFGGQAVRDGALVLDVRAMRDVRIDARRRRATVEPGVTWAELDAATQARGLAVTGARKSTIGVVGSTLGGGSGWLERRLGLTSDNLLAAELVTAEGRLLAVGEDEHPELFWALRGAGAGLGVVTELELALHPIGPTVLGGRLLHAQERAAEALAIYRDLLVDAPDALGAGCALIRLPALPALPEPLRGRAAIGFTVCCAGDMAACERALAPLRTFAAPLEDRIAPLPYVQAQRLLDTVSPPGYRYHAESLYLDALTDTAIATLVEHAAAAPSPGEELIVLPWDAAIARGSAGPLPRRPGWSLQLLADWTDPRDDEAQLGWVHAVRAALAPPDAGGFPNFASEPDLRRTCGPQAFARLEQITHCYDPDHRFTP
jgi:FAD/FMN-containing dehydrogenase